MKIDSIKYILIVAAISVMVILGMVIFNPKPELPEFVVTNLDLINYGRQVPKPDGHKWTCTVPKEIMGGHEGILFVSQNNKCPNHAQYEFTEIPILSK